MRVRIPKTEKKIFAKGYRTTADRNPNIFNLRSTNNPNSYHAGSKPWITMTDKFFIPASHYGFVVGDTKTGQNIR